nr:hypothetical protein [Tanacetum cinerariifolium]
MVGWLRHRVCKLEVKSSKIGDFCWEVIGVSSGSGVEVVEWRESGGEVVAVFLALFTETALDFSGLFHASRFFLIWSGFVLILSFACSKVGDFCWEVIGVSSGSGVEVVEWREEWGRGGYRLGDVDLLLVTFDYQLKIFDSLLNNHASGEHSQCYSKVRHVIAREIGKPVLKNKDQHILNVIDTKSWEVTFLDCVKVVIGFSYSNLSQVPIPMVSHHLDPSYCQNTFGNFNRTPNVSNHAFNAWKIILCSLCLCYGIHICHGRDFSLQILKIIIEEVVNRYHLTILIHD